MTDATLAQLLAARGHDPARVLVCRVTLHTHDRGEDFQTTDDLLRNGAAVTYARMQDGLRLGTDTTVALFLGQPGMTARALGVYRFKARRRGIAPGDIVYDYDFAHLLHSFIARSRHPTFYDAFAVDEDETLPAGLVINWPRPAMRMIRRADDPALTVVRSWPGQEHRM